VITIDIVIYFSNLIECYTDLSKWVSSHGFVKLSGIVLGATAISSYTQVLNIIF